MSEGTSCETCLYWTPPPPAPTKPVEVKDGKPIQIPEQPGVCRRFPPATVVETQGGVPSEFNVGRAKSALDLSNIVRGMKNINVIYSTFPSTMASWLCGEWKAASYLKTHN